MERVKNLREISAELEHFIGQYEEELNRKSKEDKERLNVVNLNHGETRYKQLHDVASYLSPYSIFHLVKNPIDREIENEELEYHRLLKENEELKAKLSLMETGQGGDVTLRIDEALNNAHRIKTLEQTIADYKSRLDKITTSLKKAAGEFREACFSLVGYRVDALKDNIYRLSHRYAASTDDKLYFQVKRDGTILLLKNEYADQYNRFITTYLEEADSFPAFLAAITLDLFKAQAQTTRPIDMSVIMSTTVIPANATRANFVDRANFPRLE